MSVDDLERMTPEQFVAYVRGVTAEAEQRGYVRGLEAAAKKMDLCGCSSTHSAAIRALMPGEGGGMTTPTEAGEEMDRAVGEALGWVMTHYPARLPDGVYLHALWVRPSESIPRELPEFSYDKGHALWALETWWETNRDWHFEIASPVGDVEGAPDYRVSLGRRTVIGYTHGYAPTLPLAICRAILAWKEGEA